MSYPQFVFELSQQTLTTMFHNIASTLLPCPADPTFFTDLVVNRVEALSADDDEHNLDTIENLVAPSIRSYALPRQVQIDLNGGQDSIQLPTTYLKIIGQVNTFSSSDLDQKGTSEDPNFVQQFPSGSALLFLVGVAPSQDAKNLILRLDFAGIYNILFAGTPGAIQAIKSLQVLLPPIGFPLPLAGSLGPISARGVTAAALVTDRDGSGLRIAFDVDPNHLVQGWNDFAQRPAWDLKGDDPDDERWAFSLSAQLLETSTALIAKAALPTPGNGQTFGDPRAAWDGNQITIRIAVSDTNIGQAGDVVITMDPSLDDKDLLAIQMCIGFDEDLGTAFKTLFEATFAGFVVGGIIGGPWGLLVGAIIGLLGGAVVDGVISSQGKDDADKALQSAGAPKLRSRAGSLPHLPLRRGPIHRRNRRAASLTTCQERRRLANRGHR